MTRATDNLEILKAAVLAQRLRLIDNGYRPLPVRTWGQQRGLGKAPYLSDWQKLFATADDAATWKSLSTGIICGAQADGSHLLAVDIDILDAPLALEVAATTQEMLGPNDLLRIGKAPKRLLLYRCRFPATKLRFVEGRVELLSEGNQFVAFGMHAVTGRPYEWPTGFSPENVAVADVPQARPEQVRALTAWLNVRLTPTNGGAPVDGQHNDQPLVAGDDGLIRDGRERLMRDIVWHEFHDALPNPTISGITEAAWMQFSRRAFLGDRKWNRHHVAQKARLIIRRWKAGEIGHAEPWPRPYFPVSEEFTPVELSGQIEADIEVFIGGDSMVMGHPPSSGKTRRTIRRCSTAPGRTVIYLPTRALTAEQVEYHRQQGNVVALYGRSPDNCKNYQVAAAVAAQHGNVEELACAACPFRQSCGTDPGQYYKQIDTAAHAKVVLLSQAYLEIGLPKRLGAFDRVVIDELPDFIGYAELPLHELMNTRTLGFDVKRDEYAAELLELSQKARDALERSELPTLTADDCERMSNREWKYAGRKPNLKNMTPEEQLEALGKVGSDLTPRRAKFWQALAVNVRRGELATMWVGKDKQSGSPIVRWQYRKRFKLLQGVPLMLLDGTVSPVIAQALFGDLQMHRKPVKRNLRVIQVADRTGSRAWLQNSATAIRDLTRLIEVTHAATITYKAFRQELGAAMHFGALRGLNALETTAAAIIVGRQQLPPLDAERIACLLWPDTPIKRTGAYVREKRGYRMRDGSRRGVEVPVHLDPLVQAVVEHYREGESLQAVDRLRAIHGEDKTVFVVSNVPLDLTVDQLVTWGELVPDELAVMVARGAIAQHPADLAALYPDLFPTPKVARHWVERTEPFRPSGQIAPNPYKDTYLDLGQFRPPCSRGATNWRPVAMAAPSGCPRRSRTRVNGWKPGWDPWCI